MYKLIILDDEALLLEELSQIFCWEELGFSLAGTFMDGSEALSYMQNNRVDVILSDIKMPLVTGLELAHICYEKYPNVIIALISAFRDFEYARSAMKYNVRHYILKPISYSELENIMKDIYTRLLEQEKHFAFSDNSLSARRQEFFSNFLSGAIGNQDDINSLLKEVCVFSDSSTCPCSLILLTIKQFPKQISEVWKYGKDSLYNAIGYFIPADDKNNYYSIVNYSYDKIEIICLSKNSKAGFAESLNTFVSGLKDNLKIYLELDSETEIIQTADKLLDVKKRTPSLSLAEKQTRIIISYLVDNNLTEARNSLNSIFCEFSTNFNLHRQLLECIILSITDILNEDNFKTHNIDLSQYKNINTSKECYDYISNVMEEVIYYFNKINSAKNNSIILRALDYINANYGEDITLEDISAYVAFNSNYFSSYFKQHTGEKFIDYLIRYRIEKAKEIIKADKDAKIHLICEKVGYKSIPHFYKVFRAYTGLTPAEYRNQFEKNEAADER